jgi:hypothetical protein
LLRRWAARHSNRKIARDTGTDRGTVTRYIAMAQALGLSRDGELTDDAVHEIAQAIQARPVPDHSAGWAEIGAQEQQISEWLDRERPLRLSKIHTLLMRDYGLGASYDTLRRYAKQELGWHKRRATVRIDDPPAGQEAQVDFGKMGPLMETVAGRVRTLWVLIVTLSFSRARQHACKRAASSWIRRAFALLRTSRASKTKFRSSRELVRWRKLRRPGGCPVQRGALVARDRRPTHSRNNAPGTA